MPSMLKQLEHLLTNSWMRMRNGMATTLANGVPTASVDSYPMATTPIFSCPNHPQTQRNMKTKKELPTHWEACSAEDLEQIINHGTYGQRLIARRYIADARQRETKTSTKADKCHTKPN